MFVLNISFSFSIQQLLVQRKKFQHKICFSETKSLLKLKSTPTLSIISRLCKDGKVLKLYQICSLFFFTKILKNIDSLAENNEFKGVFYQYQSFTDFNRVLFWRINSVNVIFNLKKLKKKKLLYYLRPERRVVVVLAWLKYIIKLKKSDNKNMTIELFRPLINFICANKPANEVYHLKLKIYKLRVLRG